MLYKIKNYADTKNCTILFPTKENWKEEKKKFFLLVVPSILLCITTNYKPCNNFCGKWKERSIQFQIQGSNSFSSSSLSSFIESIYKLCTTTATKKFGKKLEWEKNLYQYLLLTQWIIFLSPSYWNFMLKTKSKEIPHWISSENNADKCL